MNAQVALILGGLAFLGVAILGSGNYVKVVIPPMPAWARLLLGMTGIIVFGLAFIVPSLSSNSSGPASPSATQPTVSTSSATPRPQHSAVVEAANVYITSPASGSTVFEHTQVTLKGTAENLNQASLWVFVLSAGTYYVNDATPIKVYSNQWRFNDPYIGTGGPGLYIVNAIVANGSCVTAIRSAKQQRSGGVAFGTLPDGCSIGYKIRLKVTP
jgi:hypothetical protein